MTPNDNSPEPLMTYAEAANYLRLSPGTLRNKVSANEIPFLKVGGSVRFRRTDLDRWIEEQTAAARAESA